MSNAMEVNTEGDSADQLLIDMYQSMLDTVNPRQWRGVSESSIVSGLDEPNSIGSRIRNALEQKVTTMFVPAPDNKVTYFVYELTKGNPFIELHSMEMVEDGVSFEQAKGMIGLNLAAELREVIILFPSPNIPAFDVYRVKKPGNTETISPVSQVNKDLGFILDGIVDTSNQKSIPKIDFTYDPTNIPDWMKKIDKK